MNPRREQRGFTLVEVMIVLVLSGLVSLGLVGFYLQSQAMWLDASAQALTQRDATLVLETISDEARTAASFEIMGMPPDSTNEMVIFRDVSLTEFARFWWDSSDSLIHKGTGEAGTDRGPIGMSPAERFQFSNDLSPRLLHLDLLQMRSATGEPVEMRSTIALYNAP